MKDKHLDELLRFLKNEDITKTVSDLKKGEQLNEKGVRQLNRMKFDKAEQSFRAAIAAAPLVPAGHNNLAFAVFCQGRIDEAIHIQSTVLRKAPIENIFGMSNLVQFYLAGGSIVKAEVLANRMICMKPRESLPLGKQCEAFARLGRHQDILDAVKRYAGKCDDVINYYAGMAAANLGLMDWAFASLKRVSGHSPLGPRAAKYAALVRSGRGPGTIEGNWPYFTCDEILPRFFVEKRLRELEDNRRGKASLLNNPTILDMLVAILNENPEKKGIESVINLIGHIQFPRAVDLLKRIAEGTFGSDELRFNALRVLVEKGVWNKESSRRMWVRGKWTEVKAMQIAVTPEAESARLPEGLMPLYEKATMTMRHGQLKEGEKLWRELLSKAPAFHPAHHNLAVALFHQKRTDEAEAHLRKAMEIDPTYIFAPSTLAVIYLHKGRVKEARALLDKVVLPDRVHPSAVASFCCAQAQVAAMERNMEKVADWLNLAAQTDPDNQGMKKLRTQFKLTN
jgi:predicted Zn-dependent protease